ncbi:MAG: transglutaminase domain-containing protein [Lachnospiraceae bacterium]|nr:transglutaminase domain-containing protein [Lachnospiraceae bacterium]
MCVILAVALIFTACGSEPSKESTEEAKQSTEQQKEQKSEKQDSESLKQEAPAVSTVLETKATHEKVEENHKVEVDYSNVEDGYVMMKYKEKTSKKIKAQLTGPSKMTYTYNISVGDYQVIPITDGNGSYQIAVYQNIEGTSYATVMSFDLDITLKDEFAPFLTPSQYINYTEDTKVVQKAAQLCSGIDDPLEKVEVVYKYVIDNYTYDKEKARTVESGYLPDLDKVYEAKKGICFDYAAVMVAMLRSQNVATKLIVGYSGSSYHAWVNIYTEESGWITNVIYFDKDQWSLMDPTFASTGNSSDEIMDYIGDGSNYQAKYIY